MKAQSPGKPFRGKATHSTEDRLAGEGLRVERRRQAYFTYSPEHGGAYYFAPALRIAPPYREQRHVAAILDIANDGTLAGVELVLGELPKPPSHYKDYDPGREQRILDAIHESVNALGGYVSDTDAEGRARADVIDHVLEIIEKAGGMDPLRRRAEGK